MIRQMRASWRARARCITSGCCSQRRVLPSMSVNKKVIVPIGGSAMGNCWGRYGLRGDPFDTGAVSASPASVTIACATPGRERPLGLAVLHCGALELLDLFHGAHAAPPSHLAAVERGGRGRKADRRLE